LRQRPRRQRGQDQDCAARSGTLYDRQKPGASRVTTVINRTVKTALQIDEIGIILGSVIDKISS
jgi:hypothetical protein